MLDFGLSVNVECVYAILVSPQGFTEVPFVKIAGEGLTARMISRTHGYPSPEF